MAAMMDVMISMIFGGILLFIVVSANDIAVENQAVYNGDMLVQEMLTATVQLLEGELRNMGFGVPENVPTILTADTSTIVFLTVLNRTATVPDTVRYFIGDTTDLSGTQNERDRLLYRRVNSEKVLSVGTVTVFHLDYVTKSGEDLATPVDPGRLAEIHVVDVTIEVQNPHAPYRDANTVKAGQRNALYSSSMWQQTRLASQNSQR